MNTTNEVIHPPRLTNAMGLKEDERTALRSFMLTHAFNEFEKFIKQSPKYPVYQDEKKPMGFIGQSKLIKDIEDNHLPILVSMNGFYVTKIEGPAVIMNIIDKKIPTDVKTFAKVVTSKEIEPLPKKVQILLNRYRN